MKAQARLYLCALISGTILLMSSLTSGSAGAETIAASPCHGVDPYSLTDTQLEQCGYKTYPLVSVTPMPYGGSKYVYDLPVGTVAFKVPPPSFDGATATQQELNTFFPPAPPETSANYARWQRIIAAAHPKAPPAELLVSPADANYESENWSGYIAYAGEAENHTFFKAEGEWVEPYEHGTECQPNEELTWVGISGEETERIAQIGPKIGSAEDEGEEWFEFYPWENEVDADSYALRGDEVYAQVDRNSQLDYEMFEGASDGEDASTELLTPYYRPFNTGPEAEFIAEAPEIDGVQAPLTNFGELHWIFGSAETDYGNYAFDVFRNEAIEMWEGTHLLAEPGPAGEGGEFTDYHYTCEG